MNNTEKGLFDYLKNDIKKEDFNSSYDEEKSAYKVFELEKDSYIFTIMLNKLNFDFEVYVCIMANNESVGGLLYLKANQESCLKRFNELSKILQVSSALGFMLYLKEKI